MTNTEYLIVGAGPAGLQLGHHLQQAGRDYAILEAGPAPGGFFRTFPRHRKLISINKPHTGWDDPELNLRMDWNSLLSDDPRLLFTRYTERYFPDADDLVRYLEDYAATLQLRIVYGTRVRSIARADGGFVVVDEDGGTHRAQRVIVATGVTRPHIPPIPGIETAERYGDVSVDPRDFLDQRVLVIGKGNSGFETADNLIETAAVIHVAGPASLRMAWRTHYVGHLRAVNNNLLDTYQLKSQNALLDGTVQRIERRDDGYLVTVSFARANEVTRDLPYDRVIVCTGFRFDPSIFDGRLPPGAGDRRPVPGPDARVGVDQRARPVLRRHADAGARLQALHQRVHPRLPLRRASTAPDARAQVPRRRVAARRARRRPRDAHGGRDRPREPHIRAVAAVRVLVRPDRRRAAAALATTRSCRWTTSTPSRRSCTSRSRSSTAPTTIWSIRSTSRWAASRSPTPSAPPKGGTCIRWCGATGAESSSRSTT